MVLYVTQHKERTFSCRIRTTANKMQCNRYEAFLHVKELSLGLNGCDTEYDDDDVVRGDDEL